MVPSGFNIRRRGIAPPADHARIGTGVLVPVGVVVSVTLFPLRCYQQTSANLKSAVQGHSIRG